jgi:hypothetical protein
MSTISLQVHYIITSSLREHVKKKEMGSTLVFLYSQKNFQLKNEQVIVSLFTKKVSVSLFITLIMWIKNQYIRETCMMLQQKLKPQWQNHDNLSYHCFESLHYPRALVVKKLYLM